MNAYENYAKLRDDRGLTDYRVAKETGIRQTVFSEWKAGRSAPKIDKRKKLADFFGVSIEQLI